MRIVVNGRRMFFDVEGAAYVADGDSMRERRTVVLLHGGPGMDHSSFKPRFSALAEHAQVIYVDHSGQGRSDPTGPDEWTLARWADDIVTLCDALEVRRPIILGESFGGFVAQTIAGRNPELPSKLVLLSTFARLDLDRTEAAFRQLGGPETGALARDFFTHPTPKNTAEYLQRCLPLYNPEPFDLQAAARAVITPALISGGWTEFTTFDTRPALATVKCSTLILNGALDPMAPVEAGEEILRNLSPGLGHLETFAASGHDIAATEPDQLFARLIDFVTAR